MKHAGIQIMVCWLYRYVPTPRGFFTVALNKYCDTKWKNFFIRLHMFIIIIYYQRRKLAVVAESQKRQIPCIVVSCSFDWFCSTSVYFRSKYKSEGNGITVDSFKRQALFCDQSDSFVSSLLIPEKGLYVRIYFAFVYYFDSVF